MTSSRRTPVTSADIVRAGVPLLLLLVAVGLPWLAGPAALLLSGGVAVAAGRRAPVAWSWAAALPAAAVAALRAFGPAAGAWADPAACISLASAPVGWAIAEVVLAGTIVTTLVMLLAAKPADVGLRRPPKYAAGWAVTGFAVILVAGLGAVIAVSLLPSGAAAPLVAGPDVGVGALAPAIVFAVAVGVGEELAWRGALQGWLGRSIGPWPAVLVQAALYGVAWGGLLGSPLLGVLAAGGGLVLGATVARTRTLAVAIAWHVAFNVPFYAFLACGTG